MTRSSEPATYGGQPPETHVFISYRRGDCQPQANAVNDGLRQRIRSAHIFMDIDSIPPGVDFEQHIRAEIQICDVVLVMIGDDWLSAKAYDGTRRIDHPDDLVRLEIESALASPHVTLVPVLVEGAEMPRSTDLPPSIRRMARINAIELSDHRWSADIERLAEVVRHPRRVVRQPAPPPVQPFATAPPVDWQPVPPTPTSQPPAAAPSDAVGVAMVLVPVLSCGFLSFVPSLWVASRRRGDRRAVSRALAMVATFLAVEVLVFIAVGTAPQDEQGTPTGAFANIAMSLHLAALVVAVVLAVLQRHPDGR